MHKMVGVEVAQRGMPQRHTHTFPFNKSERKCSSEILKIINNDV